MPPVRENARRRSGLSVDDCGVAATGVTGTVRRHGANLFPLADLIGRARQQGTVAIVAGGKFIGPDGGCGFIHGRYEGAENSPPDCFPDD